MKSVAQEPAANETVGSDVSSEVVQAYLERPGEWRFHRGEAQRPGPGEARIRLEGCGVCASGIPAWEGREWFEYPMQPGGLGHEGWGVVEAIGEGERSQRLGLGDRVAFLADGSYSTRLCLPVEQILPLPKELDGLPFPAEPVGCAINVFERSDIKPGGVVGIVGMGFLGCLLLQLVLDAGAEAICFSARPWSRQMAEDLGAKAVFPLEEPWQAIEAVRDIGYGSLDRVIEATGAQRGLDIASELVGERALLVIAGYHQDGLRQINMQSWNWKGIDVVNAHERDPARYTEGMRKGIAMAAEGRIDLERLLTHRYPLREIGSAYRALTERPEGFVKGWIDLSGEEL